ncbi:MAG: hypothetical protein D3922_11365 [Candidatus Electrothrix sp. AR1]|nr:hypothetical protein [Candidatus Electrothrix sp. AR1]
MNEVKSGPIWSLSMQARRVNFSLWRNLLEHRRNSLNFSLQPSHDQTRGQSSSSYMGLTTWEKAPGGKIVKTDVPVAKNYLSPDGLKLLALFRVVSFRVTLTGCSSSLTRKVLVKNIR